MEREVKNYYNNEKDNVKMNQKKYHEFYETCKTTELKELLELTRQKDLSEEEIMFYIAIYNYFLQEKQKKYLKEGN